MALFPAAIVVQRFGVGGFPTTVGAPIGCSAILLVLPLIIGRQSEHGLRHFLGRGVKVSGLVERRVSGNQVDGAAVHPAQKGQIIAVVQRPVGEV